MSFDLINNAANALNDAQDAYHGKIADINERITTKENEVDAFLNNAENALMSPRRVVFDPEILHSKTSLNLATDPVDNTRTIWRAMDDVTLPSISYVYTSVNARAFVIQSRNFRSQPGTANNPPFSQDYSHTIIEYVCANSFATQAQIEQAIIDEGVEPTSSGHAGNGAFSTEIPIVNIAGVHPYHSLFLRLRNIVHPAAIANGQATAATNPQPITTHGGNSFIGLHAMNVHPF